MKNFIKKILVSSTLVLFNFNNVLAVLPVEIEKKLISIKDNSISEEEKSEVREEMATYLKRFQSKYKEQNEKFWEMKRILAKDETERQKIEEKYKLFKSEAEKYEKEKSGIYPGIYLNAENQILSIWKGSLFRIFSYRRKIHIQRGFSYEPLFSIKTDKPPYILRLVSMFVYR